MSTEKKTCGECEHYEPNTDTHGTCSNVLEGSSHVYLSRLTIRECFQRKAKP